MSATEPDRSDYGPTTALVVVDMQNDFVDAGGSLCVRGAGERLEAVNREIDAAVRAGALVVLTQDWHPPETPHFETGGGVWPVHCVADTWGAALVEGLRRPDGALTIHKGTSGEDGYSAFSMRDPVTGVETSTPLPDALAERGVTSVVVVGVALDVCVRATAEDAMRLGYDVTLVADATAAVDLEAGDGYRAVAALVGQGVAVV